MSKEPTLTTTAGARFSTVASELGAAGAERDVHSLAL
jgi:catalase